MIIKRLTAVFVAVVFVFGTALIPVDLYAVESDAQDVTAAEVQDPAQIEAQTETEGQVETEVDADQSAAQAEGNIETEEQNQDETIEQTPETEATEGGTSEEGNDLEGLLSLTDEDGNSLDISELDENEYDGFIYKLEDDATKKEIKEMETAIDDLDQNQGQEVSEVIEKELYTADSLETIEEVADEEIIEYIEPNYILRSCAAPNDPGYSQYSWQVENTNIPYAWNKGMTGTGAVVAVLDSGVNTNHKDLAGAKFVNKYNMLAKSTNVTDNYSHGTSVTGIIAATRNNGIGFAGAMSKTSIMPVKVLNDSGSTAVSVVVEGIKYAVAHKADVINMSFGGTFEGYYSTALEEACKAATKSGVILVAAAGNEGDKGNPILYPAAYDSVISVGSVDKNNNCSTFSTYNDAVTVAAPGDNVCLLLGIYDYYQHSGTSFSAPQVSALAAMVKSRNHNVTPSEFLNVLKTTSTDLGDPGRDDKYGYGLINYAKVFDYMATKFSNYSASLSTTQYVFNGSVKSPAATVNLGTKKLVKGTNYKVTYASGRKAVGTYKVTVSGINGFSGTKTLSFKIVPPLVKGIKAPTRGKKKLTVRWKAMTKKQKTKYKSAITGYQVRYSTSSKFTSVKYKKVKGYAKTKVTIKSLKKKTTYYVQYRSYKTVGSTTYYSKWSSTKKAKTK